MQRPRRNRHKHKPQRLQLHREMLIGPDVRIGDDAVKVSGYSKQLLQSTFWRFAVRLTDDSIHAIDLKGKKGEVRLYIVKRGRAIDVGTAADWKEAGWSAEQFDELDAIADEAAADTDKAGD